MNRFIFPLQTVQDVCNEVALQRETAEDVLPVSRLAHDRYNSIIFYIDRNKAFRNIIQDALSAGEKYGHQVGQDCGTVVVNPVDLMATGQSDPAASLTQLRAVVLLKHILHLLIANG